MSYCYSCWQGRRLVSSFLKKWSRPRHYSTVAVPLVGSQLTHRALTRLTGPDTIPFLQGLITNDIAHLEDPDTRSIFALLLNHQGRVLFDVLIYSLQLQGTKPGSIYLESDRSIQSQLIKHLKLYRVKKKVEIQAAGEEFSPWVAFNQALSEETTGDIISGRRKELILGKDGGVSDPRLALLGWRFILPKGKELELDKLVDVSEYRQLLVRLGVGEGILDYPVGNSLPLESNGDYLHGISFHKGCYVGQELTARTHHTGVVRKRLMPFSLPEGTQFPTDTDVSKLEIKNCLGKSVGKVRNITEHYGLALTRIEEALSATELKIGDFPVFIKRPNWWPIELSKESIKR